MTRAAVVALALLLSGAARADLADDAKANCAAEWPGDYQMQAFCVRQHSKGADEVAAMMGQGEEPPAHVEEIAQMCLADWPGTVAGVDWPMVAFCMRQQLEAYDALNR